MEMKRKKIQTQKSIRQDAHAFKTRDFDQYQCNGINKPFRWISDNQSVFQWWKNGMTNEA